MSKLLIVESPAKAKTISKYLDGKYAVKASIGHVRDLPKSNKKAIDIEGGFIPHYEVVKGKEKVIREIKDNAQKADEILLATDPDREGEAIAWHLAQVLKTGNPKRVVFNEITKDAVQEALKHPREIDDRLRKAQEARRVLDRLVGYDLSGLIWKKVRYGLSAGRVQSPALRIIMEREREIRSFKPEDFWIITADVKNKNNSQFVLTCSEEPTEKKEMQKIMDAGKNGKWSITNIKENEMKRAPRTPFITSTLQQSASTRLSFVPSKTMSIAQKLYEAGHITYMRTDSTTMSSLAHGQIEKMVEKKYGKQYLQMRVYKTKSRLAQEAHEAIRPTNILKESAGNTNEQKKLYRLIWQRTVASQMTDAKLLKTKMIVKVADGEVPDFTTNGSRTLFDGWLKVDPSAAGEDVELPKVDVGEILKLIEMHSEERQTQPPFRYTEAGLIKELEKRGIGRPSTYASIMKTLNERGYVTKEGKTLFPTDTGDVVSTFLENNFKKYISDSFTAEMENELDEIASGEREYIKTLSDFYTPFTEDVNSKKDIEKITNLGDAPKEHKCPKCGADMIIKLGKTGKFLSCSKFPNCPGARMIDGEELKGPKETGEECPECKSGKLVERDGRFGRFISCNNYPKCKFIKQSAEEEARVKTGVKCNKCSTGEMIEKRGRYGIFYSCSNYPKCKYAIKAQPTGNICKLCGSLEMQGTKTIPERCSEKTCPNHNPHKLEK
ncbi:MAG: type I DNA topoisomerase [Candidatus Pacebacteria bacterium]|jgi:DNA topoisomerase-1|nr:type I DNA topoisomerase [Candidatus Paceibacterota bacterium]|tara:strand:- start:30559 stop:32727 length:2169 start_codon:yes stop_codon:yes gene_type:complete